VTCDNTAELLAIRLRPGNAGANTAADHLDVLTDAIVQIPAPHRRHLLIRGDSAAATHAVLDWLTGQNTTRRTVEYSLGWSIGEPERTAIGALPAAAWSPALAADGNLRDGAQVAGKMSARVRLGRPPGSVASAVPAAVTADVLDRGTPVGTPDVSKGRAGYCAGDLSQVAMESEE
jgi:hypothetical protein